MPPPILIPIHNETEIFCPCAVCDIHRQEQTEQSQDEWRYAQEEDDDDFDIDTSHDVPRYYTQNGDRLIPIGDPVTTARHTDPHSVDLLMRYYAQDDSTIVPESTGPYELIGETHSPMVTYDLYSLTLPYDHPYSLLNRPFPPVPPVHYPSSTNPRT